MLVSFSPGEVLRLSGGEQCCFRAGLSKHSWVIQRSSHDYSFHPTAREIEAQKSKVVGLMQHNVKDKD